MEKEAKRIAKYCSLSLMTLCLCLRLCLPPSLSPSPSLSLALRSLIRFLKCKANLLAFCHLECLSRELNVTLALSLMGLGNVPVLVLVLVAVRGKGNGKIWNNFDIIARSDNS